MGEKDGEQVVLSLAPLAPEKKKGVIVRSDSARKGGKKKGEEKFSANSRAFSERGEEKGGGKKGVSPPLLSICTEREDGGN